MKQCNFKTFANRCEIKIANNHFANIGICNGEKNCVLWNIFSAVSHRTLAIMEEENESSKD